MTFVSAGNLVRQAVALLSPPSCAACDEPVAFDALLCGSCEPGGQPNIHAERLPDGAFVVSTGPYTGGLAQAVRRLKYGNRPDLSRLLGVRLAGAIRAVPFAAGAALAPVPLHRARLAERGYNQAALVAGHAARALGVSHRPLAVGRTRRTREQAALGREERLTNVVDAFTVREDVAGLRVIVVDDVVTTGATARACVRALEERGAQVVAIAALARANRPDPDAATLMDDAPH
jgi:ComF family protein